MPFCAAKDVRSVRLVKDFPDSDDDVTANMEFGGVEAINKAFPIEPLEKDIELLSMKPLRIVSDDEWLGKYLSQLCDHKPVHPIGPHQPRVVSAMMKGYREEFIKGCSSSQDDHSTLPSPTIEDVHSLNLPVSGWSLLNVFLQEWNNVDGLYLLLMDVAPDGDAVDFRRGGIEVINKELPVELKTDGEPVPPMGPHRPGVPTAVIKGCEEEFIKGCGSSQDADGETADMEFGGVEVITKESPIESETYGIPAQSLGPHLPGVLSDVTKESPEVFMKGYSSTQDDQCSTLLSSPVEDTYNINVFEEVSVTADEDTVNMEFGGLEAVNKAFPIEPLEKDMELLSMKPLRIVSDDEWLGKYLSQLCDHKPVHPIGPHQPRVVSAMMKGYREEFIKGCDTATDENLSC